MSQDAPALTDSFLSCSSSDASSLSDGMSQFFPLQEEVAGKAEKAPVADQSWWDEFGEWESASKVSHLPQPRHTTCLTQPRLVIGDDVVRLPIARLAAQLPYASFPEAFSLPIYSVANKTKLTLNDDIFMVRQGKACFRWTTKIPVTITFSYHRSQLLCVRSISSCFLHPLPHHMTIVLPTCGIIK